MSTIPALFRSRCPCNTSTAGTGIQYYFVGIPGEYHGSYFLFKLIKTTFYQVQHTLLVGYPAMITIDTGEPFMGIDVKSVQVYSFCYINRQRFRGRQQVSVVEINIFSCGLVHLSSFKQPHWCNTELLLKRPVKMLRMRVAETVGYLGNIMLALEYLLPGDFQPFVTHETENTLSE